ncbi:MAG: amidase [Candidatus Binataceae bacterium]
MTLSQAAQKIANGRLSPVELTESCLRMIDRLEPRVKAWVTLDRDGAMREAAALEREAREGRLRGPLHGIPLGVKDIFYTAGMRTTGGHAGTADFVPDHDAAVIERLKRSGAIILGKTTTTEFALLAPTPTHNPWKLEHTPGGSSSGSGAAVAARMCPAAIGSQTGGSTLRPAAYCGIVGLKPTHGRVSVFGMIPLVESTDHPGILGREVADLARVLQVIGGYDPRDHTSLAAPVPDYISAVQQVSGKRWNIAWMGGDFHRRASDAVREAVKAAAARMREAGAQIDEMEPPPSYEGIEKALLTMLSSEAATYHQETLENRPETLAPKTREMLEAGLKISASKYIRARQIQRHFKADIARLLEDYDAILVPATPAPAPHGLDSTGDPVFNSPWSMTGNPAIALPCALDHAGMPIAIQLVGAALGEPRLLEFARWCEGILRFEAIPEIVG